jgi:hypothetical protein
VVVVVVARQLVRVVVVRAARDRRAELAPLADHPGTASRRVRRE